jgi:hypothetical protein
MTSSDKKIAIRDRSVANMLATLRIENLKPSISLMPSIQQYISGAKSTDDLLTEVQKKYVSLLKKRI